MDKDHTSLKEDIIWHIEAGIDACIGDIPINRFGRAKVENTDDKVMQFNQNLMLNCEASLAQTSDNIYPISQAKETIVNERLALPLQSYSSVPERAILAAVDAAESTNSISDLRIAVEDFEGCVLKKTAMNTVFSDGNSSAKIMFIGTVPGADEDRKGLPFVGLGGQLLNKMLASINLNRSNCYMTNIIFWRPPGDRDPTENEIAVCLPFVERHIELVSPEIIVLLGGPTSKILLDVKQSINKIHGQFFKYSTKKMTSPILTTLLYHPNNLLSSPASKQDAWRDLLKVKEKLFQK